MFDIKITRFFKICSGMVICAALVMTLSSPVKAQSTLEKIRDQGYATIGMANEPPWTAIASDGKITGAGPEIVRSVLKMMGVQDVKGHILEYGAMIPALQAERIDLISAGVLFMKPVRCEAILFSLPDICDGEGFAVKAGNPHGLKSYADVARANVKIGVCGGCTEEQYAREAGVADSNIVISPDGQSGAKMLQDGRIDVYALPASSIVDLLSKFGDKNLEAVTPVEGVPVGCTGVGFRKADREFRDSYDQMFLKLKASGEYSRIMATFNFPDTLEATTSRKELCGGPN